MEITKTFVNTYDHMLRAKLWRFRRRSIYRYALAVVLLTLGLHGSDPTMTLSDKVLRGVVYFVAMCGLVLVALVVSAWIQSRRIVPRTITFSEEDVVEIQNDEVVHRGWDWIARAQVTEELIYLTINKRPPLIVFLSRAKLMEEEFDTLYNWLASNGKLATTSTPR